MNKFIPYEDGAEWHYLSEKHAISQGGHNWNYRFGFNFYRLTNAEQKRYRDVYAKTMRARGMKATAFNF